MLVEYDDIHEEVRLELAILLSQKGLMQTLNLAVDLGILSLAKRTSGGTELIKALRKEFNL